MKKHIKNTTETEILYRPKVFSRVAITPHSINGLPKCLRVENTEENTPGVEWSVPIDNRTRHGSDNRLHLALRSSKR